MEYKHIIYRPGKVARVILNRPRYYNAQGHLMRIEMEDAFQQAVTDDSVGAIVLSGEGKHFSTGHDLGTQEDNQFRDAIGWSRNTDRFGKYNDMRTFNLENHLRWRNLPKPTIAMVQGYCIFGGWMFAAVMDVVFAAEDALFLPGPIQYFSMPYEIGSRKTKEILFENRFLTAREVYRYGFVNRLFSKEKLEEETLAYAERLADNYLNNPLWVRMTKFSVNHMEDAMGFTREMEAHYNAYMLMLGLQPSDSKKDVKGGFAQTDVAMENLEATKPWLKSINSL
jgi:enoyl-CoA hydratase